MRVGKPLLDIRVFNNLILKEDESYVLAGSILSQLRSVYPGGIVEEPGKFERLYKKLDVSLLKGGEEILLFRSGGIGDIMFLLPLVKLLKIKYDAKVKVATSPTYMSIFDNNPYIDKTFPIPFHLKEMECDYQLMFEGIIEDVHKDSQKLHAVDLFLKEAGVDHKYVLSTEKIPEIFLSEREKIRAKKLISQFGYKNSKKVGLQIQSSSPIRNFPLEKIIELARDLLKKDYIVFLIGGKRQSELAQYFVRLLSKKENRIINLVDPSISLRKSFLWASQMDLIIAPDSAFVHIAGALGIPIIGLYAPFPSKLRMKYYKNAIGLDSKVVCGPCFQHGHNPCKKGNPSPCFFAFSMEKIMGAVDHFLESKDLRREYPAYEEYTDGELFVSYI